MEKSTHLGRRRFLSMAALSVAAAELGTVNLLHNFQDQKHLFPATQLTFLFIFVQHTAI